MSGAVATDSGFNNGLMGQCVGPPAASFTKIEAGSATATAASSVAFALANAGSVGDGLVVSVYVSVAGDITSVTDTVGNVYTLLKSETAGTLALYTYGTVVTAPWTASGGATPNTITANLSASITSILMFDHYSCVGGVQGFDMNVVAAQATNAANSTATLNTQFPSVLVVVSAVGLNTAAPTAGAGFAMQSSGVQAGATAYGIEDQAVTGTGSTSHTVSKAVTCAMTGISTSVGAYSTTAVAMVATCAPPFSDHTVCFFVKFTTVTANLYIWSLVSSAGGTSTLNALSFNAAGQPALYPGFTNVGNVLSTGIWYFIALTFRTVLPGNNVYTSFFVKPVGSPTCSRFDTDLFATATFQPVAFALGDCAFLSTTNVLPSHLGGPQAAYAGLKIWPGIQLTQEEIERESEQIEPRKTAGLWGYWPLTKNNDLTSQTANTMKLVNSGSTALANLTGPPIREYSRSVRVVNKRANVVPSANAPFFNIP
jgi:hypothetical protein